MDVFRRRLIGLGLALRDQQNSLVDVHRFFQRLVIERSDRRTAGSPCGDRPPRRAAAAPGAIGRFDLILKNHNISGRVQRQCAVSHDGVLLVASRLRAFKCAAPVRHDTHTDCARVPLPISRLAVRCFRRSCRARLRRDDHFVDDDLADIPRGKIVHAVEQHVFEIERRPRAPVLRSMALVAMARRASSRKSSSHVFHVEQLAVLLDQAFLVRSESRPAPPRPARSSVATTGRRPTNSGISP